MKVNFWSEFAEYVDFIVALLQDQTCSRFGYVDLSNVETFSVELWIGKLFKVALELRREFVGQIRGGFMRI